MSPTLLEATIEINAYVERGRAFETLQELSGQFTVEQWRDGQLYKSWVFPNGATDVGKQYLLGAAFAGTTPITTWYLGVIDGTSGTPILVSSDTILSHGWTEFTYYSETVRQTWAKAINTLTNQMGSSAAAQFTIASPPTSAFIAGAFLVSDSAKAGTAGTLYATGLFPSPVPVQTGDIFKLNYITGL